ncbi:UNKNOWN [Stylonychia lemnae]|uniref:Uncharacterized protein n=1 Tax=Stylonychia lemnae TaxID=5949 RepID=A0A078AX94_STYLE|nr:UNKNOWN [Stylonychia lemnae]|eukprot:CDW85388.1 UNKNOWN [Stylonychia lemnae]
MKRALALLEQTKNTMPHLPRPVSGNDSDSDDDGNQNAKNNIQYQKGTRRNPSASGRTRINDQAQSKFAINNTTDISSRKSTAVSSTTRIGSSGNAASNTARNNKRQSFVGAGTFTATDIIEKQSVYELSLKQSSTAAGKKPPHKLRPLNSIKNIDNKANSILEIENAYQKEMLRDIDADLNDYLDTNQILSQMQNAFGSGASSATNLGQTQLAIAEKKDSKLKQKLGKTIGGQLDPILEEAAGQIIPYQPNMTLQEQRAKKNEALKNKVKKLTGTGSSTSLPSITNGNGSESTGDKDAETFITGTKIAQQQVPEEDQHILREYESQMATRKKKYYKYEEDELLDDLDQHERDMNEMLKYLSEVEELIKGQDLKSIQQMMDVTKETMNQHFQACDKFKGQIQEIDNQAEEAIRILNFYDNEDGGSKSKKDKKDMQLERVIEDRSDDEAEVMNKKQKPSHEQSKHHIVNKLNGMNQSMRDFTSSLESRLDRAYKTGATKKFGYDGVINASQQDSFEEGKEERILNKMHNQAQQFIEQNSASALLKSQAPSTASTIGRKNSHSSSTAMRALPPSEKRKGSVKNTRPKKINDDLS